MMISILFALLACALAAALFVPRDNDRELVRRLAELDDRLVAAGFPALSPWWRANLVSFLLSGKRRLVLRCGRRAGKSSSLCRLAVVVALWGAHVIPPGDVGVVAIISTDRTEAARRLRTITAILDVIGVSHRPLGEGLGVQLIGRPIAFQVFAATISGVSGFTCIFALCDEVAKWRDADTGANPATEVLGSLRPAMATQPLAREVLSSSPVSTVDAHYDAFELGETPGQAVAYAESWIANPTLSEEQLRRDVPDRRIFDREFRAIPQAARSAAFDGDATDRAFRTVPGLERGSRVRILDPSSGRKDAWTWADVGRDTDPATGRRYVVVEHIDGIEGSFWKHTTGEQVVETVVAGARRHGITTLHADQRESLMLASAFGRHGMEYVVHDWTGPKKTAAVECLRRWLADGEILIEDHRKLRREMASFEEHITASGAFTFAGRGGGHDDFVALLLTAAMADLDGGLVDAGLDLKSMLSDPHWRTCSGLSRFSDAPDDFLRAPDDDD